MFVQRPCDKHMLTEWPRESAGRAFLGAPFHSQDNCCSLVGEEEVPTGTNATKQADANGRLSERVNAQSMARPGCAITLGRGPATDNKNLPFKKSFGWKCNQFLAQV